MVDRMAAWLKAQGIGQSDVVSVILPNSPERLVAHYAVPAVGAVLSVLNNLR